MKMRLFYVIGVVAGLFFSCYDDKGNYDYEEFAGIKIEGIQDEYSVISYKDTLHISPKITPEDEYEYLWTINESYTDMPSMGEGFPPDTIGMEKELKSVINYNNGHYDLTLKVTSKKTGYAVYYNTKLVTQSVYSRGFYVLKETADGNTEVDIHTENGVSENLLEKNLGKVFEGRPVSMGLMFVYCYVNPETGEYVAPRALSVSSEKDLKIFNLNDMGVVYNYEDMFYGAVPQKSPLYLYPNFYTIVYLSGEGICTNYQDGLNLPSAGKFGTPVVIDKGCRPSRHMIVGENYHSYLFDELNQRFLALDHNGTPHFFDEKNADGSVNQHSPNAVPKDNRLLFFGINSNSGFALFEKQQNTQDRYLYNLKVVSGYANPIEKVDTIDVPKMKEATVFGNNVNTSTVLYYGVGDELYLYEIGQKRESRLNLEGFDGGEITYISNRYWLNETDKGYTFDYLVVGTYKDGKYHIYMYNTVGGIPSGKPVQILEGVGKVVKVHYNSPYMTSNAGDTPNYPVSF